jgi:vacuolar-type H+-ATPase subunit H
MTERSKASREGNGGADKETGQGNQLSEMEAEIDQTRSAISGDLRTLGERLSPENLKENAKEVVTEAKNAAVETLHEARDAAGNALRDAKDSAVETVSAKVHEIREDVRRAERETLGFLRENAVPLALIGIGVTWFMVQRRTREAEWNREYRWGAAGDAARGYPSSDWRDTASSRLSDTQQRARELTHRAGDRAQRWVESAEHTAQEAAGRVRGFAQREMEAARHVAHDAEHKLSEAATRARGFAGRELRQARDFAGHATETHPLAVGAAALAVGIGVGLALPQTRREAELLGPKRERLAHEAKEMMGDWTHAASETARDMKESLTGARPRA